jgi:hypothetical protein
MYASIFGKTILILMNCFFRIIFCNLLASTFVINLTDEFSKEIGLKFKTFEVLSIFGTNVMYETFMLYR